MFQRNVTHFSADEYLALEEQADYKSEFYKGEIFAMAGGSYNHNVITGNLFAALNQFVAAKPCAAFTGDMRLLVEKGDLYTYPDVMVVYGQPQFATGRTDTIMNPVLIVEVLSRSTQEYDRGLKFELYRTLDTFQDYLLIDQDRVHLEYYQRLDRGQWLLTKFNDAEAVLMLAAIEFNIPISRLYQKVDWFDGR